MWIPCPPCVRLALEKYLPPKVWSLTHLCKKKLQDLIYTLRENKVHKVKGKAQTTMAGLVRRDIKYCRNFKTLPLNSSHRSQNVIIVSVIFMAEHF